MKVLMIGNSFSICVLKYMPSVAAELGCPLDLTSLYIGGCPLQKHAANIFAGTHYPEFRPYRVTWSYASLEDQAKAPFAGLLGGENSDAGNIPQLLASDKWDVVTIQQASHESWIPGSYHPWADLVVDTIRKLAPQARIFIQQTWSYCNADPRICDQEAGGPGSWGIDQSEMYARLTENYKALAAQFGFEIIPTGKAVQLVRERRPVRGAREDAVGNFRTDENGQERVDAIHLNRDGEYLQACVWTAKLFGADVTKLTTVPEDLGTPANAALLRECARDAAATGA